MNTNKILTRVTCAAKSKQESNHPTYRPRRIKTINQIQEKLNYHQLKDISSMPYYAAALLTDWPLVKYTEVNTIADAVNKP